MPPLSQAPSTTSLGQAAAGAVAKRPIPYGRTGPGTRQQLLGDKVRQETSMALERLLKQGSFRTGLESVIQKVAQQLSLPLRMPQVTPHPGLLRRYGIPLALGGATAGAIGLLGGMHGLEEDRKRDALVYSPLQGVS